MSSSSSKTKKAKAPSIQNYLDKIGMEVQTNQSKLNLILGALIVLVIGVLVFNYFNRSKPDLGPAQQTQQTPSQQDVTVDNLPGKYTVKTGDTLFTIAQTYYNDGYKYDQIAKTNNLSNPDILEIGQVLDIPSSSPSVQEVIAPTSDWGPKITENTYTVVAGDWLSTISARAYGDVNSYKKIAEANNITNPDLIETGQVLTIPR